MELSDRVPGLPHHRPAPAAPEAAEAPPAAPERSIPLVTRIDDTCGPADVVDMLLLGRFASGEQPCARSSSIDSVKDEHPHVPDGGRVLRSARTTFRSTYLVEGEGWTLQAVRRKNAGRGEFHVTAVTDELAQEVLDRVTRGARKPPAVKTGVVSMAFWYLSSRNGPYRTSRDITAEPWEDIRPNYGAGVARAVDGLMALDPQQIAGRLLLLHGPPGTGKTTALRALAHAWREWCTVDCILDPERLFNDPGYLMDVAIGDDDDDEDGANRWRLLLLEDCDELIRAQAKDSTGQALSRLLNLTDGLLGQGRRVLVGITTNEDVEKLHPAVVRPGRCLGRVEVGRLTREESAAWLGRRDGLAAEGNTLAELYALRGDRGPVVVEEEAAGGGMYL